MAITLNNGVTFKIGATSASTTDLSTYVTNIQINREYDQVETTAMGSSGRTYIAGLEQSTITVTFNNEYSSATGVNQVVEALVGTKAYFESTPGAGSVSASNPKYSGNILIASWSPINGAPGDLATVDVTWNVVGAITKATS